MLRGLVSFYIHEISGGVEPVLIENAAVFPLEKGSSYEPILPDSPEQSRRFRLRPVAPIMFKTPAFSI